MFVKKQDNQGGVIIITALVVLVIAAVLAITFATSMRLEEKTAATYRDENNVSFITQAGYEYALALLRADNNEYDALKEAWRTTFNGSGEGEEPAVNLDGINNNGLNTDGKDARWIYLHSDPAAPNSEIIGRFAILIVDEASKINLHASGSGAQNQGWTPFEIDLTNLDNPNTGADLFNSTTAGNLVNYREGDKTGGLNERNPGDTGDDDNDNIPLGNDGIDNDGDGTIDDADEGTNEPDEYVSRKPYGSGDELDLSLKTVDELTEVNKTEESKIGKTTMRMCKNFTTVDATGVEKYWDANATPPVWKTKENINALTSVEALFNLMTSAGVSSTNAARWTTNIIDYSDRDNIPTVIATGDPIKKYIGIEGLQINEVMARVHPEAYPVELDNWDDPGQDRWDDPDSFTDPGPPPFGNWNNNLWTASGEVDGGIATWKWKWDNGTYDIYIYRDDATTGLDFHYVFQGSDLDNKKEGDTEFAEGSKRYLVHDVTITTGEIELTLTARNVAAPIKSWFQCLSFNPTEESNPNSGDYRRNSYTGDSPPSGPISFSGSGWDTTTYAAQGIVDGGEGEWIWGDITDGDYEVYIYQNLEGGVTNPYDFVFEEGEAGELSGTATFGEGGTNTWYHVGSVTVSGGQLTLKLIANYTPSGKSWFNGIGVVAGQYVELINLSPQPITIDKTWGINVGGNIVLDNNTAKIDSSTPGTTYKFTWFKDDAETFTIPSSSPPAYTYFIAADSVYALDYKFSEHKDGDWGPPDELGELVVIDQLHIPAGGANISLIREVDDEQIVVDFVPCTATASGFGTSAWDIVSPAPDKSLERRNTIRDDSVWALCSVLGTPGANNSGYADVLGVVKDRPFPSPGFIMDVYKGTDNSQLILTDVRDFIHKLTTAYYRLEIENSSSPPAWSSDLNGMDGTRRYYAPDVNSNATLTWNSLHIPDGTYNLFIAGDVGEKFQSPSGTNRTMGSNGLAYCDTATITDGSLTFGDGTNRVFGDGSNFYSLDYILLIPNKNSPPSIGKININTASAQVLNAMPPAFDTGAQIIDYRNGPDNKDGTTDDNPFENIGEYLSITLDEAQLEQAYQKQANLITVRSDIFEIIVLAQSIDDLVRPGQYDAPPLVPDLGSPGILLMSDKITAEEKIRAIVDRSSDPPKTLYFRRELK